MVTKASNIHLKLLFQTFLTDPPSVSDFQLGDRRLGGLQRLLWSDRVAAALGELSAEGGLRGGNAAAEATICEQQTLHSGQTGGKTDLQPGPLPPNLENRTLDPGMKTRKIPQTSVLVLI